MVSESVKDKSGSSKPKLRYTHPFLLRPLTLCAHRGDSVSYPENTIEAFSGAVETGLDYIETDIHLSKDGHCIISHDPKVDRTTDACGYISEYTLKELKTFDAGYRFTPDGGESFPFRGRGITIPTLSEALDRFPDTRFNVDLKVSSREIVDDFVSVVRNARAGERVLGASFYRAPLLYVRRAMPELASSFSKREAVRLLFQHAVGGLSPSPGVSSLFPPLEGVSFQVPEYYGRLRVVTPSLIRGLHSLGIAIQVWTINSPETMKRLLEMGVDGVMTDRPGDLAAVASRSGSW